ncbi:MAG: hypothetical protein PWQ70_633 [Clostridiales bacterium]|nr:hypothetical protein [Clostridiales bacterium]
MVRKKQGDKENAIIEAAVKVFSQKSYHGSTTSEIAKEAGVAEGTIFRYFRTKKDILSKILIKVIESYAQTVVVDSLREFLTNYKDSNANEKEVIKALLRERLKVIEANLPLVKILFTEIQFHPDLRKVWVEKVVRPSMDLAVAYIEKKKKEGKIKAEVNAEVATRSFVGMVFFMVLSKLMLYEKLDLSLSESGELDQIVDILFEGIAARTIKG